MENSSVYSEAKRAPSNDCVPRGTVTRKLVEPGKLWVG